MRNSQKAGVAGTSEQGGDQYMKAQQGGEGRGAGAVQIRPDRALKTTVRNSTFTLSGSKSRSLRWNLFSGMIQLHLS